MGHDLERVVDDIPKWDLYAGAYEWAMLTGAHRVVVDHQRAVVRYVTGDVLSEIVGPFRVEVWVSLGPRRGSVVHVRVESNRLRGGAPWLERWAARRVMRLLLAQAAKPRRSLGVPGWYPDPIGPFARRWWDGNRWTPLVWWRDGLRVVDLDHAWHRVSRDSHAIAPGALAVRMSLVRIPPLPPPVRRGTDWVPRRRRVVLSARDWSLFGAAVGLLMVLVRIWFTT